MTAEDKIKFGNYPLTPEQYLAIAEYVAKNDDFVWDEFTDKEKWGFAEAFISPIPQALESVGLKMVPIGMICHW